MFFKHISKDTGISSFYYSYNGSIGADSYSYEIRPEEGQYVLTVYEMQHDNYGELTGPVQDTILNSIEQLCVEMEIRKWDGFNKSDPHALDGDGFSLKVIYKDGSEVSAHGSNSYPKGYHDFRKRLRDILKNDRDMLFETKRQEFIAAGLTGDPTSAMINFMGRGRSGSDKYEALIYREPVRDYNVNIRVKSVSGDIWDEGEYSFYGVSESTDRFFAGLKEIVDRLNIISWMDYDKAAADYNNEEWFQIDIGYEDGSISAMGTEHPDNYDEFRREVLALLKELSETVGGDE